MDISQFDYSLPKELIAHKPADPRDSSKLLCLDRQTGKITHHHFYDLPALLRTDDVLVFNQTKVFPARLLGHKTTGGKAEILLLQPVSTDSWRAIGRPCLKVGQVLCFDRQLTATVKETLSSGEVVVQFSASGDNLINLIDQLGHTPLPPYIHSHYPESKLRRQYQTVYAKKLGSAAAPTAGLHFTPELFEKLKQLGVQLEYVTLHVGLGTFKPISEEQISTGKLHKEPYFIDEDTKDRIIEARKAGRRIISVGTTTARVLESYAATGNLSGDTDLFINPPYQFKLIDGLITNFHLPQSSLLMLVSSFVSKPNTKSEFSTFSESSLGKAYDEAVANNYRFFSFGDAMLISE